MNRLAMSRRGFVFAGLGLAAALLAGNSSENRNSEEPNKARPRAVRLVIDYDDGVQKVFTRISWKEGMTVLDAMNDAARHHRGIKFKYTGGGATAFLTQIDDLRNEGGGRDRKNWLFWVNDKLAKRSFGVYDLRPSDRVLWKYAKYDPSGS